MATYVDLHEQALKLFERAEQQRRIEVRAALEGISKSMNDLDIGLDELINYLRATGIGTVPADSLTATSKRSAGTRINAMYINSATGETWSGRGRPPRWIVESESIGVSRDAYLRRSPGLTPST